MLRPMIAGNWKMNTDRATAVALAAGVRAGVSGMDAVEVALCPPAIYLFPIVDAVRGTPIRVGAQNLYFESSGAFTGELSAAMIADAGCTHVILGHSERRHTIGPARQGGGVWGEDDGFINRKLHAALAGGLTPILCVGETLAEREAGQTEAILSRQMTGGLADLQTEHAERLLIAYEPVWAIGTGRNATPEQAQQAHAFLRGLLRDRFGPAAAESIRILYGGSVKAANAAELTGRPDVDGALVGGASLKADEFCGIIRACASAKGLA